jgi:hypothetical protein
MSVLIVRGIGLCSVAHECSKPRAAYAQSRVFRISLGGIRRSTEAGQADGLVTAKGIGLARGDVQVRRGRDSFQTSRFDSGKRTLVLSTQLLSEPSRGEAERTEGGARLFFSARP